LNVKGRSDLFLKLEVVKKSLIIGIIVVSINFGIMGLIWGQVVTSVLAFFINTHFSGKFLNYSAWQQIKDFLPFIALAVISGLLVWWLNFSLNSYSDLIRLILGGLTGSFTYLGLSRLFKINCLFELKNILLRK
jgi:O-antigen/teichoic acid export membrane protein